VTDQPKPVCHVAGSRWRDFRPLEYHDRLGATAGLCNLCYDDDKQPAEGDIVLRTRGKLHKPANDPETLQPTNVVRADGGER